MRKIIDYDNFENFKVKLSDYAHSEFSYYSSINGTNEIVTPSNVDKLIAIARTIALVNGTRYPQIELYLDTAICESSVHTVLRLRD